MQQLTVTYKKSPIKSSILNFQYQIPIKLANHQTTRQTNAQNLSQSFNKKMHKSTIINQTKYIKRLVNSKSKASENKNDGIINLECEKLLEQPLLFSHLKKRSNEMNNSVKASRTSSYHQNMNTFGRKSYMSSPKKTEEITGKLKPKLYDSKVLVYTKRDKLQNHRSNNQKATKRQDNKQQKKFITSYRENKRDKKIKLINKRFKSVENQESLTKSKVFFQNLNTDSTYRDTYRINKINMFDYERNSKNPSSSHNGIEKFYGFCKNIKLNNESKIKNDNNSSVDLIQQDGLNQQNCFCDNFKPYNQQPCFEYSNKFSPSRSLFRKQTIQQNLNMKINRKELCVRQLRKKQSKKLHIPNFEKFPEEFTLEGWKELYPEEL